MRIALVVAALLLASFPLGAQAAPEKPDTAPPSPGKMCAERDGRCDDTAVRGRDCMRDREGDAPCVDGKGDPQRPPRGVQAACVDRDLDAVCDAPSRGRFASFFAAIGGAIASLWRDNVPEEKGGGKRQ